MKTRNLLKQTLTFAAFAGIFVTAAAQTSPVADYEVNRVDARMSRFDSRPGEVIVKLKTRAIGSPTRLQAKAGKISSSSTSLENFLRSKGLLDAEQLMTLSGDKISPRRAMGFNGQPVADSDLSGLYSLRFKNADVYSVIEELRALDDVEYAEPNYIVYACADASSYSNDPLYSEQWGPAAIGLDKLWQVPLTTDKRPVIAILDTGVDITHPDLADNIWTNEGEADGADGRDDDGNGFTDDLHGWDFVNQSARMRDNNGHGTHCAGIAAAVGGNGIGISGANPDAIIMPVTVMQSSGQGDVATIIKGIDYATANGADVISMSFGTYSESMAMADALGKAYQKAILVAAAGNDNFCIYQHLCPVNKMFGSPMFPAAYSFVLGVEASADAKGTLADFSNFDEDGPVTSTFSALYNYELRAPGTGIQSTFPGGQYRKLNGTSMACPLVAGALSRLISVKEISSKEELFGDLIHTTKGNIDIYSAYSLSDAERKPTLSLVTYRLDDAKMGDGDGRADAGETIRLYPTFRNAWGNARNITYTLRLAETEDPQIVEFMDAEGTHVISNLSSYASAEAENPFILKISPDCVDGRIICFELIATCDNISKPLVQPIQLSVENGVELGGVISENMTLTPDKNYIVTSPIAIGKGATLTILPGTTLKFNTDTGIKCYKGSYECDILHLDNMDYTKIRKYRYPDAGKVIACGTPDSLIQFTSSDSESKRVSIDFGYNSQLNYCKIHNLYYSNIILSNAHSEIAGPNGIDFHGIGTFNNCLIDYFNGSLQEVRYNSFYYGESGRNVIINSKLSNHLELLIGANTNIIRNEINYPCDVPTQKLLYPINILSNYNSDLKRNISLMLSTAEPSKIVMLNPMYFGSSDINIVSDNIWDINHKYSFGDLDLGNMLTRPVHEAHGIVWKVVVNGYDAQDEYDWLAPLGVGRHKFEVWFNREMNHDKTPFITMGVREPYTQTAISEDGSWRSETMENGDVVDVYTAYLTIQGRDNFDGVNTIYVSDAEDDEYFPIPIEDVRFHVNVQSAGSMSSGFTAEPGVGKVTLNWENPEENFDDMLGYNMYRYTLDENDQPTDSIRINEQLLTTEQLIDYDIVPGTTYCYYYKVLRTSLAENAASKVVAATPRAAGKGDANGSGDVDVADVVTEVNYMLGETPKPFIFDAADVNSDSEVDILDVVGTVNLILKPAEVAATSVQSMATYWVENGRLYVESPVDLAGIQLEFSGVREQSDISVLESLKGMENTGSWVSDINYRFLAFSLSGKTIASGCNALLDIINMDIEDVKLVDTQGKTVMAMAADKTGISSVVGQQMRVPSPNPFTDMLNVPVLIGTEGNHSVIVSLTSLSGQTVLSSKAELSYGEHNRVLDTTRLSEGMYLLVLNVDGADVQTCKVIRR